MDQIEFRPNKMVQNGNASFFRYVKSRQIGGFQIAKNQIFAFLNWAKQQYLKL